VQGIFAPLHTTAGHTPYTAGELALLGLAGLAIAVIGALGPAIWAAASRATTTLRAE
jgi:putative ABC transport system permease protein